jgi:predicted component of type VI protein secretion system
VPQLFEKLSGAVREHSLSKNVANDILLLINASIRGGGWQGKKDDLAFSSVLNFGNPPLACFGNGIVSPRSLASTIHKSIVMFESRLVPSSIKVMVTLEEHGYDSSRPNIQWPVVLVNGVLAPTGENFRFRMRIDIVDGHASADF